jgi:hypothetical protein
MATDRIRDQLKRAEWRGGVKERMRDREKMYLACLPSPKRKSVFFRKSYSRGGGGSGACVFISPPLLL